MCKWLAENLGKDIAMHFSRAFPMHDMMNIEPTPQKTLDSAKRIAEKYLDYVYLGNTGGDSNTHCPKCGALLISRKYYNIISDIKENKCSCGHELPGVF